MSSSGVRRLTRSNFYQVGEWAGASECWELSAPIPEIRIQRAICVRRARQGHGFVRVRLGDIVIQLRRWVVVI